MFSKQYATNSKEIAEYFGYDHHSVITLIGKTHLKSNEKVFVKSGGRPTGVYALSEEDCKYLLSRMKYTIKIKEFFSEKCFSDSITIHEHQEIVFERKLKYILDGFNIGTENNYEIRRQFNVLGLNIDYAIGCVDDSSDSLNGFYPILFIEVDGSNHKYTFKEDQERQKKIKEHLNWYYNHENKETSAVRFCRVTESNEWKAISEIISILNGQLGGMGADESQEYFTISK